MSRRREMDEGRTKLADQFVARVTDRLEHLVLLRRPEAKLTFEGRTPAGNYRWRIQMPDQPTGYVAITTPVMAAHDLAQIHMALGGVQWLYQIHRVETHGFIVVPVGPARLYDPEKDAIHTTGG